MFEKRCYIVSGLILICSLFFCGIFSFCKSLVVDEFKPVSVIFLVDSSSSNQKYFEKQKKYIKNFCFLLDPEDRIKIMRVSNDSYLIFEGSPQDSASISKSLNSHIKFNKKENCTNLGFAIKKAMQHCLVMTRSGYIPAIVVVGKFSENKNIDWDMLALNIKNSLKYTPELSMSFLFAEPEKLDKIKEKLVSVLGEDKLIIATEITVDKINRKFYKSIGR